MVPVIDPVSVSCWSIPAVVAPAVTGTAVAVPIVAALCHQLGA